MVDMMTPARLAAARQRLGLTLKRLGALYGVAWETVWRWEKGEQRPPGRLLELLVDDLEDRLIARDATVLLDAARQRLAVPSRWIPRDVFDQEEPRAEDAAHKPVDPASDEAVRWNLGGALSAAMREQSDVESVDVFARALNAYIGEIARLVRFHDRQRVSDSDLYKAMSEALSCAAARCHEESVS